jgi:hypothetical protein
MTICVKEPESGEELQLAVKLLDTKHRTEWLVTLPTGDGLLFKYADGHWTTNQDKKINDEFTEAIARIISLLSIHQQAEKDLDKFFRDPGTGSGKSHNRKY